jgi:hypothetical protein
LKREEGGWVLHHGRKDGLVVGPDIGIAHGRMLLVLDGCQFWLSSTPGRFVDKLTYLRPFRFLYRFPHTSHLNGFSFSMPSVPG